MEEEKRKIIKTFEGGYNRVGKIWCEKNICNICGEIKICICSDGSNHEYGYAAICPKCVARECEEYDKKNKIDIKKILIEKIKEGPVSKEPSLPKLTHENLDYIEGLRDEYIVAYDKWAMSNIRNWLAMSKVKINENGDILIPKEKKGMRKLADEEMQWLAQYFNIN